MAKFQELHNNNASSTFKLSLPQKISDTLVLAQVQYDQYMSLQNPDLGNVSLLDLAYQIQDVTRLALKMDGNDILLMTEILHHLESMKPYK